MAHRIADDGAARGWALAAALAGIHAVNDGTAALLGGLLPALDARLGLGATLVAAVAAVYWIASSAAQPLLGALAERHQPRAFAAVGVALLAVSLGLAGATGSPGMLLALAVIGGLGSAALHPAGTAIAGTTSGRSGRGIPLFLTGGMVGLAAGPLVATTLLAPEPQRTLWLIPGGIAVGALTWWALPRVVPHPRRRPSAPAAARRLRGPLAHRGAGGALAGLAAVAVTGSLPLWLVTVHGIDPHDPVIGLTLFLFALGGAAGALTGGVLASRPAGAPVVVAATLVAPLPLIGALATGPGPAALALVTLGGALTSAGLPMSLRLAQDAVPDAPGMASGLVVGLAGGIAGVLYLGIGVLQGAVGLQTGLVVSMLGLPGAALFTLLALRAAGQPQAPSDQVAPPSPLPAKRPS